MSFSSTVKRGTVQAAYTGKTLPDRRNSGYLKPLRTGENICIRPFCHWDPYRKSGSCKKILYIIEKTFNINTDVLSAGACYRAEPDLCCSSERACRCPSCFTGSEITGCKKVRSQKICL